MNYQFSEDVENYLRDADRLSKVYSKRVADEMAACSLKNKNIDLSETDHMIIHLVAAYGILYNRAVEAGWVRNALIEKPTEENKNTE